MKANANVIVSAAPLIGGLSLLAAAHYAQWPQSAADSLLSAVVISSGFLSMGLLTFVGFVVLMRPDMKQPMRELGVIERCMAALGHSFALMLVCVAGAYATDGSVYKHVFLLYLGMTAGAYIRAGVSVHGLAMRDALPPDGEMK